MNMEGKNLPTSEARARTQELIDRIGRRSGQFSVICSVLGLAWFVFALRSGWFGEHWLFVGIGGCVVSVLVRWYVLEGTDSFARKLQVKLFEFPVE
jgi:hypothetical protein